jgi:hypothetical protein
MDSNEDYTAHRHPVEKPSQLGFNVTEWQVAIVEKRRRRKRRSRKNTSWMVSHYMCAINDSSQSNQQPQKNQKSSSQLGRQEERHGGKKELLIICYAKDRCIESISGRFIRQAGTMRLINVKRLDGGLSL